MNRQTVIAVLSLAAVGGYAANQTPGGQALATPEAPLMAPAAIADDDTETPAPIDTARLQRVSDEQTRVLIALAGRLDDLQATVDDLAEEPGEPAPEVPTERGDGECGELAPRVLTSNSRSELATLGRLQFHRGQPVRNAGRAALRAPARAARGVFRAARAVFRWRPFARIRARRCG